MLKKIVALFRKKEIIAEEPVVTPKPTIKRTASRVIKKINTSVKSAKITEK